MKTLLSLTMALFLAVGCGSSDNKTKDKGVTLPDGPGGQYDGPGTQPDGPGGQYDLPPTQMDQGPAGSNSGQTCDQNTPCADTADSCLLLQGWTKGMCFGKCAQQGDVCPTSDNTKYLSTCALTDQSQTQWYCLYVCEAQGQTYECPDPTTQDCVASTTAGIKICAPK